jgi:hypothetical protein
MRTPRLLLALLSVIPITGCTCASIAEDATAAVDGSFGTPTTSQGLVVAFLNERRDGHSGEHFWRDTVAGFPKETPTVPIHPTEWRRVLESSGRSSGGSWTLFRYRIESTTNEGVPIRKLWDFCIAGTVRGPRLVATWDADDMNQAICSTNNVWPKYQYR